ncbi:hypothetical protein AC274_004108 [Salmonella enterica subsp. enterica]|nr:hypothetical protein [Salmonella enterica subsp. enterica]
MSTPARWSDGVTAALLSYNLMTNLWSTFHWYWHLQLHAKDLAGKWHSLHSLSQACTAIDPADLVNFESLAVACICWVLLSPLVPKFVMQRRFLCL